MWSFSVCFGCGGRIEVQFKYSGHGTIIDQETVISSVAGTIERVNKLVGVRAIRTKMTPKWDALLSGGENFTDGAMSLHPRSLTYGKVPPVLHSGVEGSHCYPASKRSTRLCIPHSYQMYKVSTRYPTM